jgi:hypothetical protein
MCDQESDGEEFVRGGKVLCGGEHRRRLVKISFFLPPPFSHPVSAFALCLESIRDFPAFNPHPVWPFVMKSWKVLKAAMDACRSLNTEQIGNFRNGKKVSQKDIS